MKTDSYETVLLPEFVPDEIEPGKIYVVLGTPTAETCGPSVTYKCPCGCGQLVYLPCRKPGTNRTATPQWEVEVTPDNKVNISPSVLETGGCKSHYFIKAGKVQWT